MTSSEGLVSESTSEQGELPVPLSKFADALRPQITGYTSVFSKIGGKKSAPRQLATYSSGDADQVWVKLLAVHHGNERHTMSEWRDMIDQYRQQPAYSTGA